MYKVINLTGKELHIGGVNFSVDTEEFITDQIFKRYREEFKVAMTDGKLNILGKNNLDANFNFKNEQKTVGIFIDSYSHYSGGRYYTWFLAHALVELNYNVVVISNQFPVFAKDFLLYKKDNLKFCINSDLDFRCKLDYVIGTPLNGIVKASNYSNSQKTPLIGVLFETPNFSSKYHSEFDSTERYWASSKRHYTKCDKIITISKLSKKYVCEWLNFEEDKVLVVEPCINSRVADSIPYTYKEKQVIAIGRAVKFKGFDDLQYLNNSEYKIRLLSKLKQPRELINVDIAESISDAQKFTDIKKSKVLLHPSKFEGFGLTLGEAVYCDVPVVAYDLEVYKDFYDTSVKYAKDLEHFKYLTYLAVKEGFHCNNKLKTKLKFESFVDRVDTAFRVINGEQVVPEVIEQVIPEVVVEQAIPKVTIGIICLNEAEYIDSCLKGIYDWECCHEIIVVEGSTELYRKANPKMVSECGSSIDSTCDIIREFPDASKKIKFISGKWKDKLEMRSQYMDKATGDYIFLIDADEFYTKEDLGKLKSLLLFNPDIEELKFTQKIFWHRFDKILGGSFKNLWLERFWKNKDIKLSNHHRIVHSDGRNLKVTDTDICCYHYSNIRRGTKYVQSKINFYSLRNKEVYNNKYKEHIKYNKSWLDWDESISNLPRGVKVIDYDVTNHPEVIKEHPYYNKGVNFTPRKKGSLKVAILYFAQHPSSVSGGQYAAWRWVESLILNDVDVTFIGDGFPQYANDEVKKPELIQINLNRGAYNTSGYPEFIMSELEKKVKPDFDVVIGVASSYILPMALYAKKYKIPFVSIVFENPYSLLRYAGESFKPVLSRPDWKNYFTGTIQSDLILCPSDSVQMWSRKWLCDYPNLRFETLYPPINEIASNKVLRQKLKKKDQLITIGYWGGKKSSAVWLLEASKLLKKSLDILIYSQYPWHMPKYDTPLQKLKEDVIIKHRTSEEEKFTDLSQSLVCINPYATGGGDYQMKEGFAVKTLGLSFNIPVLIECVGGFGEIVAEGKLWEYLRQTRIQPELEEYFIGKLADKLNWLLANKNYMKMKTEIGHKYIMENHTMQVIGKRFKDLLISYFK